VTERYDAIIVGAGPAGSTAARHLARAGARVLLADRARFPRDKPCGGGITFRADAELGIDLEPVTERFIYGADVSVNLGSRFERAGGSLLARMTQRSRLDAYLVEQATLAGAEFRDGVAIREVEVEARSARARANGDDYEARVLIAADGVNGVVARTLGMPPAGEHAVAFEANYPAEAAEAERWERQIGLDLGGIPGGYGWVFPKGDHLNVGVGGWEAEGPTLRARLSRLCAYHGFDESRLYGFQGYRLPMRRAGSPVVSGAAMLAGDAACLVDPLSGEGIWAAFASGRLAAAEARRFLGEEVADLSGYQRAIDRQMDPEILASRRLQMILQRLPNVCIFMLKYNRAFWNYMVQVIRGELTYPDLPQKLGPLRLVMDRWADAEIRRHERKLVAGRG
jgi:geranylgeranyl reductase family protein